MYRKAVCTTTINPVTPGIEKMVEIAVRDGWMIFIAGDLVTPHNDYYQLEKQYPEHVRYLDQSAQEQISQQLSDLIGWRCIQRRNFAMIAALGWGAEVLALWDDDNIPLENWGTDIIVGKNRWVKAYDCPQGVFDPVGVHFSKLWHRGYPVQLLRERLSEQFHLEERDILIQADLWNGDPDIDAICRIAHAPDVTFSTSITPYSGEKMGPFNSQNTFLSAKVFPTYFLFPHIGRMDDIWASYVTQAAFPKSVAYCNATVKQERNPHDLVKDLKAELLGYEHTEKFIDSLGEKGVGYLRFLPDQAIQAYSVYKDIINSFKHN